MYVYICICYIYIYTHTHPYIYAHIYIQKGEKGRQDGVWFITALPYLTLEVGCFLGGGSGHQERLLTWKALLKAPSQEHVNGPADLCRAGLHSGPTCLSYRLPDAVLRILPHPAASPLTCPTAQGSCVLLWGQNHLGRKEPTSSGWYFSRCDNGMGVPLGNQYPASTYRNQ